MKPVLVLQHLEPEQPAVLGDALRHAGCALDVVRTDLGQAVPVDLDGHAGLVVLGGPMSASSDDGFPSRRAELALVEGALSTGVPTLGVCLGAQLLAVAAGASIRVGDTPEIGWGEVELTTAAAHDPLLGGIGSRLTVLHWHGETFDLPSPAVHLARSGRYANQAFRIGAAAWGLQFHVEVDRPAVERFVAAFPDDAARADGGAAGIAAATASALAALAPARGQILERFVRMVTDIPTSRISQDS